MATAAAPPESAPESVPPKRGKKALLLGLVLAFALGSGGFWVMWSGILFGDGHPPPEDTAVQDLPEIAYVPIEPVIVSLPGVGATRQLRFTAQIEVPKSHHSEVAALMPRVLDLLNGYLRAIEPSRFDEPGALPRIRAQLLRRLQIITGEGRVRDLLVTEFILQ